MQQPKIIERIVLWYKFDSHRKFSHVKRLIKENYPHTIITERYRFCCFNASNNKEMERVLCHKLYHRLCHKVIDHIVIWKGFINSVFSINTKYISQMCKKLLPSFMCLPQIEQYIVGYTVLFILGIK